MRSLPRMKRPMADVSRKRIWVTEFASWHSQDDGAQITTLAKQKMQMTSMVTTCSALRASSNDLGQLHFTLTY